MADPGAGAAAGRELAADPRTRRSTTSCCGIASRPPGRTRPSTSTRNGGRAVVLPGQLYAYYDWGGTIDPILPVLTDTPVATRNAVGYADLRATDLLWTTDALVQQRRAVPNQLDPLLDLLGARTVLAGADDDRTRSGAAPAAEAADMLDQLGRPDAAWGARANARGRPGTSARPAGCPQVRAWDRPDAPGLVRVERREPDVVVDGSAEGLAALAPFERFRQRGLRG